MIKSTTVELDKDLCCVSSIISTDKIESLLRQKGYEPLRWAIVNTKNETLLISVSFEE